jgi:hypothetical protein
MLPNNVLRSLSCTWTIAGLAPDTLNLGGPLYWQIGKRIQTEVLQGQRAEYGLPRRFQTSQLCLHCGHN